MLTVWWGLYYYTNILRLRNIIVDAGDSLRKQTIWSNKKKRCIKTRIPLHSYGNHGQYNTNSMFVGCNN